MRWFLGLRKQVGALMVALVLAMWLSAVGHGKSGHPGVDETIFTIKRPQQV
ncbi:MAG: hypothetical protein ACREIE_07105 [Nitrospiraceae bacterium]